MADALSGLPLIGGFFPDPTQEAHERQMRETARIYGEMRGPYSEARTQALQNMLQGIAGPGNQMMGQMYGQDAMMDFGMASQNPVTPQMAAIGQPGQPGGGYAGAPGGPAPTALEGILGGPPAPTGVQARRAAPAPGAQARPAAPPGQARRAGGGPTGGGQQVRRRR